jgi:hypothetical protein
MASEQQQLLTMHEQAVATLEHKLSLIPDRVFTTGHKPTISDIYLNNREALYMLKIPEHLQLHLVSEHYHEFVAMDFKARKLEHKMNIALAIWYWQMDENYSFSRTHRQVRYNILMACVVCTSANPLLYVTPAAHNFCIALINAWVWSVSRQDDSEKQAESLSLWAEGPYDLMYFGKKKRDRMVKAIAELEQYVPKKKKPIRGDDISFWEGLRYTSAQYKNTFGVS